MNRRLKLAAVAALGVACVTAATALAVSTPRASTGGASSITDSSAVLHGTVNPGGAKTGFVFQWGVSTTYGSSTTAQSAGKGKKNVAVEQTLHRLLPGTTYHYRIAALSSVGGIYGGDHAFITRGNPPAAPTTGGVSSVTANSATITGLVNPNNVATNWYVEYGVSTAYGLRTPSMALAAGVSPVPVSAALTGLQSGKVFHYRIVAVNRGITEVGNDATFMTYPSPARVPRITAKTKPGHDGTRPYTFTTSGMIHHPSFIQNLYACTQPVRLRYFMGGRRVGQKTTPVLANCTFSAKASFKKLPKHAKTRPVHLKVVATFLGNGYLAEHSTKVSEITEG